MTTLSVKIRVGLRDVVIALVFLSRKSTCNNAPSHAEAGVTLINLTKTIVDVQSQKCENRMQQLMGAI